MLAERVAARVPDAWKAWVARGLSTSPLEAQLAGLDPAAEGQGGVPRRGTGEG
jgi:hypothetical protein